MADKLDTGGRVARIIQLFFVALFVIAVVWFVVWITTTKILKPALETECQRNLKIIAQGLQDYLAEHDNHLPRYLTELYPNYVSKKEYFICPADKHHGKQGCIPAWLKDPKQTGGKPFSDTKGYVDLDGPTMTDKDKDTIPCSYLYEYNQYPCWLRIPPESPPYQFTWAKYKEFQRDEVGKRVGEPENVIPVVRCFHHLPPGSKRTEGVTLNVLMNLSLDIKTYPYEWGSQVKELSQAAAGTPAATKLRRRAEN